MKLEILTVQSREPEWLQLLQQDLLQRFRSPLTVEVRVVKAGSSGSGAERARAEGEKLLKSLATRGHRICWDESGRLWSSTAEMSRELRVRLERGPMQMVIGGAYGLAPAVKQACDEVWSLSPLTMNHHLALAVSLEQVYRCYTLWQNHPYHNA